jgi:hypothetical protein
MYKIRIAGNLNSRNLENNFKVTRALILEAWALVVELEPVRPKLYRT